MAYYGRNKNKIQEPYTVPDFYTDYIKTVDEGSPYHVSYEEYAAIVRDFFKEVANEILAKASTFRMPYRLGSLRIVKLKSNMSRNRRYSVDFNLTNKFGKTIYHLNEHSGGYKYMFKWDKVENQTKHNSFYRFKATRTNARELAKNIKNKIIDYFENY